MAKYYYVTADGYVNYTAHSTDAAHNSFNFTSYTTEDEAARVAVEVLDSLVTKLAGRKRIYQSVIAEAARAKSVPVTTKFNVGDTVTIIATRATGHVESVTVSEVRPTTYKVYYYGTSNWYYENELMGARR